MNKTLPRKEITLSRVTEITIILMLLHNIPIVGNYTPASIYGFLVLLMYALLLFEWNKGLHANISSCFKIIGVLILVFITDSIFANQFLIKNAYGLMQLLLYPFLGMLLLKYDFGKTYARLFWVVLLSYVITSITTYFGCQLVPNASRILASTTMVEESGMENLIKNLNIAGFSEIYTIALITPLIVMMMRRGTMNYIIGSFVLFAFIIGVIEAQYTTALFVCVLSLLLFFLPKNYSRKKYISSFLFLTILCSFGLFLISELLTYLSSIMESSFVGDRLSDLSSVLSGNQDDVDNNSDMMKRRDIYLQSIETFLSHPLGAWDQKATGGHSFILDSLARFGVLGVVLIGVMYKRIYTNFIKPFRMNADYGYAIISFFWVIFLAIVNPNPNILFVCFILPLFYRYSIGRLHKLTL